MTLACYWIFLFASTHVKLPNDALPRNSDKLAHFVAYAGLSFLLGLWMSLRLPMTAARYVFVFLVVAAYGAVDEVTQIPVGRTADVWDWAADCVGTGLGLAALLVCRSVFAQVWPRSEADEPSAEVPAGRGL